MKLCTLFRFASLIIFTLAFTTLAYAQEVARLAKTDFRVS
jgi:hypothetical protein